MAARELTSLILDEERLRAERSDRKTWKSRVSGIEEFGPPPAESAQTQRRQNRRRDAEDQEDAEYRLAIEASLNQEEEDRRKRESRGNEDNDDELERALKLSREEEEARKQRELDKSNASLLFEDAATPQASSNPTGFNQGYQQGSAVDFFANPIDQNQVQQQQPTGYLGSMYTGYQQPQQATGMQMQNGFGMMTQATGYDAFAQQQQQQMQVQTQMQQQPLAQQATNFNPYAQQMQQQQQQQPQEATPQPGSNNPWATNSSLQVAGSLQPASTGSNNPFAQNSSFNRPQAQVSTLGALPEQQPLNNFASPLNPPFGVPQQQQQPLINQPQKPQKEMSEHEAKLNAILASGDGMDTFGNTGDLRIPAQHTAPGTFVNSAGANLNRLNAETTGNNPFMRQQLTGMPQVTYSQVPAATGPAGLNVGVGAGASNPFSRQQQPNGQGGDLIQL